MNPYSHSNKLHKISNQRIKTCEPRAALEFGDGTQDFRDKKSVHECGIPKGGSSGQTPNPVLSGGQGAVASVRHPI